jgi:hypothetical protein
MTSRRLFSMVSHKPNALRLMGCCRDAGGFAIEQARATEVRRQLIRRELLINQSVTSGGCRPGAARRRAAPRCLRLFLMGIVQYC